MATFLTQNTGAPQPGDGSFLLHSESRPKQRRQKQKKLKSFLVDDAGDETDNKVLSPQSGRGTFLEIHGAGTTSLAAQSKPRTIAKSALLSRAASSGLEKKDDSSAAVTQLPPSSNTFLQHSSQAQLDYTTHQPDDDTRSMASMTMSKAVPPHLRPKQSADSSGNKTSKDSAINIREKLSELGVGVSDPKPVTPPLTQGWGNGNAWATQDSTTAARPESPTSDKMLYTGRGGSVSKARGRGGRGGGNAARSSRWPAKADFPKVDPKRWETTWEDEWNEAKGNSQSTSIDSARADGGWGNNKKQKDGDGFALTDYNGNWAPAPTNWDSRPAFRSDQSESQIQRWLDCHEIVIQAVDRVVPFDDVKAADGFTYLFSKPDSKELPEDVDATTKQIGDIIPSYWIPPQVGKKNPQVFWDELVRSTAPTPVDHDDLSGARPWWERRVERGYFLEDPAFPNISGINPDETLEERLARENDEGSLQHAQNRKNFELAKIKAKREKKKRVEEKAKRINAKQVETGAPFDNRKLKPDLNMYIRSARLDDIPAIRAIFNHYVRFTCATPETEDRTEKDIHQRFDDIQFAKMPFLVACEKGGVLKAGRGKKKNNYQGEDIILPDKIVGFAYADDYNDMLGMYRFTAEVEIYTHQDSYMKGVANCLMDKMMALLDPNHLEHGGYEVQGDELEGVAPRRFIKNIIINFAYEKPQKLEWMSRWLEKSLGFEKTGQLDGIGTKLGKAVNLAIFQRTTGAELDHANPPNPTA